MLIIYIKKDISIKRNEISTLKKDLVISARQIWYFQGEYAYFHKENVFTRQISVIHMTHTHMLNYF